MRCAVQTYIAIYDFVLARYWLSSNVSGCVWKSTNHALEISQPFFFALAFYELDYIFKEIL